MQHAPVTVTGSATCSTLRRFGVLFRHQVPGPGEWRSCGCSSRSVGASCADTTARAEASSSTSSSGPSMAPPPTKTKTWMTCKRCKSRFAAEDNHGGACRSVACMQCAHSILMAHRSPVDARACHRRMLSLRACMHPLSPAAGCLACAALCPPEGRCKGACKLPSQPLCEGHLHGAASEDAPELPFASSGYASPHRYHPAIYSGGEVAKVRPEQLTLRISACMNV